MFGGLRIQNVFLYPFLFNVCDKASLGTLQDAHSHPYCNPPDFGQSFLLRKARYDCYFLRPLSYPVMTA